MDKHYQPHVIEPTWRQAWEEQQLAQPSGQGPGYCIMLPPPNVTGSLHMGHGFQQTLMDALIRYHKMRGYNVLWQGGVDHAGIATQMVVENQLALENKTRHDLGRENFIARVWEWKHQSGSTITQQIRRLGALVDWSREKFTMDDELSLATRTVFIQLHQEGLIYRGKRLVNWDTKLNTAISDLEVENKTKSGKLWHIRYPILDSNDHLVIATTRPETLLGDAAVAVHPEDPRYQHLIGQQVELPLCDRTIPIIADDYVDQSFGTGCVKITPAHDFNDYAVGQRHQLPIINILDKKGFLNENVPASYQQLDRFAARKQIIDDLSKQNLLEKIEDHQISVPIGKRSGTVIEPLLTDQWFINTKPLAKEAIHVVEQGKIKFIPENWTNTYMQWMHNIEDWCISRQLWWGHQIPAWYDVDGNIFVGLTEEAVREQYQLSADVQLTQDPDVLDTWFTSALWPFATLGWPTQTPELETFYPTNVLITGFDIIFFWIARMIMMGLKFMKAVPFKEVYVTGLIRDASGQKMSKSKGNVLDPVDVIDGISLDDLLKKRTKNLMQQHLIDGIKKTTIKEFPNGIEAYGTDALRFTYCALANTGRDINFDLQRVAGYRNFCNKLWNAARFVLMNTTEFTYSPLNEDQLALADRWILNSLQELIAQVEKYFQQYRFDLLTQYLYEFIWNNYCDWYLEAAKTHLNQQSQLVLLMVLDKLLKLCHPIIPFITESIWQEVAPKLQFEGRSLVNQPFPHVEENWLNPTVDAEFTLIKNLITSIRTIRSEMNINPGKKIPLIIKGARKDQQQLIDKNNHYLINLAKLNNIEYIGDNDTPDASATSVIDNIECHLPMADLIDKEAEEARLQKEIGKLEKEKEKLAGKLNNPNFTEKAPADIVEKQQELLKKTINALEKLQTQLQKIQKL